MEHFERLVAGYIAHDRERGQDRTVRQFVAEFAGLSSTAKQKKVLDQTSLSRASLSSLANCRSLKSDHVQRLLSAMQAHTKPVQPRRLGAIGKDHLRSRCETLGGEMESFRYKKIDVVHDDLPWLVETAFCWCPELEKPCFVTGVNWSAGILDPFRELGEWGESLDSILEQQRAGNDEPVLFLLHVACPRVEYTDRGKSAVAIPD